MPEDRPTALDAFQARRDALTRANLVDPVKDADVAWLHAWLQDRSGRLNQRAERIIAWLIEQHLTTRPTLPLHNEAIGGGRGG